jgi:hypothetical protein
LSSLRLCVRVAKEEEEGEYASYHREAEQENSFGAGVGLAVADTTEPHAEDTVIKSIEGREQDKSEHAPEEQCSGGR